MNDFLESAGARGASWLLAAIDYDPIALSLKKLHVEDVLLPVLVQLVIILIAARVAARVAIRLGQPGVVGEIAAGLLLGPSLLGKFFPELWGAVFHPNPEFPGLVAGLFDVTLNWIFSVLSQLGLILLLFLVGLEFDFAHLKTSGRSAAAISLAGILLPFTLGALVGWGLHPFCEAHPDSGETPPLFGMLLFMGTAMSITALPILGRMMMEFNLTRTQLGVVTISAAAIDDVAGWTLLATVSSIVKGDFKPQATAWMVLSTVLFAVVMIWVVRPLLVRWVRYEMKRRNGQLGLDGLAIVFVLIFAASILTNKIGIFAIFGAFTLGACLSTETEFREAVSRRLRDLVTAFFLPIFFTYTGLRTNIGSLSSGTLWLWCGLVLAAAVVGKMLGCSLAARMTGFSKREAGCIGVMMNTRALMELIVINVGYQLRVIPPSVFCMLVIMALVTTVMTTPLLTRLIPGTSVADSFRESEFARRTS